MGRSLAIFIGLFVSLNTSAQENRHRLAERNDNSAERMAEDVSELVRLYDSKLNGRDSRYIQKSLSLIIDVFAENGYYVGNPRDDRHLICDSSDNTLRDLTQGKLIWDFGSMSNCTEALEYVSRWEPFCDYGDNTLHKHDGVQIHDFASQADCKTSREAVLQKKPFCDFSDNTLYDHEGKLIYDFSNSQDCIKARDAY